MTARPRGRTAAAVALAASIAGAVLLRGPAAFAGDRPFTFPSNLGLTGLLETPTARVMPVNRFRAGATIVDPYREYFGTIGLFPRLEVNGRVTEVRGVPGFVGDSAYGDAKDKAVDLKFQFLREGKYAPALALVVMDPHGTRLYSAQALVASKQIFPFDFTVGIGNGRYGKRPLPQNGEGFGAELFTHPRAWWDDAKLFGGVQFAPSERFALVAEYSPIEYHNQTSDPAQPKYFRKPVPSHINVGLRVKPTRWSEIDLSYQRGNEIGLGFSVAFDVGKPMIPIYDRPYVEPPERLFDPLSERIAYGLHESGFSDIGVDTNGLVVHVEAQNDRYLFPVRAIEAVLDVVAPRMPDSAGYLRVDLKENGVPTVAFITTRAALDLYYAGRIDRERFLALSTFKTDEDRTYVAHTVYRRRLHYQLKPTFETFLNDPSGFFRYRLGITGQVRLDTWTGGSVVVGAEGYPVNTVSTANKPLSIPVRSDIVRYKREKAALSRLLFEQIGKTRYPLYGRIAAGLLEVEYAGLNGEIAAPFWDGRVLLGAGASLVRKRRPDNPVGLLPGKDFHTAFLKARLNVPEADLWLDVKGGRFLAGDWGARTTLSKSVNGVVLSAWYTVTDTSEFTDPFNRGYHDKGISVTIPLRLFLGRDSKTTFRYSLSPWTRDVGQDIDHDRTLFDYIGMRAGVWLAKEAKDILPERRK